MTDAWQIIEGDCRDTLKSVPDGSVQCCITSPPYYSLRDYGCDGQIGLEATPQAFVAQLVAVFREVRRVLRDDGTLWLNLGDSYCTKPMGSGSTHDPKYVGGRNRRGNASEGNRRNKPADIGLKHKDVIGIPWRVAFALQADGWILRQDIIWHKPAPMPESVRDRCTKAHEHLFLLAKSAKYHYDADAIREKPQTLKVAEYEGNRRHDSQQKRGLTQGTGWQTNVAHPNGCNKRSVWSVDDERSLLAWLASNHPEQLSEYLEQASNATSVLRIASEPFKGAHFATFPPALVEPCIKAGCPDGGLVLDPFSGAGTVGVVARRLGRRFVGLELSPEYAAMSRKRIADDNPLFHAETAPAPTLFDTEELCPT